MAHIMSFVEFNHVMRKFLTDLTEVFPEDPAIQASLDSFDDIVRINYKKPSHMFFENMQSHARQIVERDETMFDELHFPGIDFKKLWNSSGVSSNTKHAIFEYLHQLLILSSPS